MVGETDVLVEDEAGKQVKTGVVYKRDMLWDLRRLSTRLPTCLRYLT